MTNTLRALIAGALLILSAPAIAADVASKSAGRAPEMDIPAASVDWSGLYIAAGIGADVQVIDIAGTPFSASSDRYAITGRIGYRYQPKGSQLVAGAAGEISYTDDKGKLGEEYSLIYSTLGEFGIATGGVLVVVQVGYSWQTVDNIAGAVDLDFNGPFAGVELDADLGGNWAIFLNGRAHFQTDDSVFGTKLESTRNEIKAGLLRKF